MPGGTRGHPRVIQGFGYGVITHYDRTFQTVLLPIINPMSGPHNPHKQAYGFGLFRVRSPLLTESLLAFFSSGY